jgi:hypothetical protein
MFRKNGGMESHMLWGKLKDKVWEGWPDKVWNMMAWDESME